MQTAAVSYGVSQKYSKCEVQVLAATEITWDCKSSGLEQTSRRNIHCNSLGDETVHPQAGRRDSLNHQRI